MSQAKSAVIQKFALSRGPFKTFDPFLFCVHHRDDYPRGEPNMGPAPQLLRGRDIGSDFSYQDGWSMYHGDTIPGFPEHPHRGFETITVTRRGTIDHSDSLGCTARYGEGDVQWMTAGAGIQHAEMFPLLNTETPNPADLFQVWLNLPKRHKMCPPSFAMFWHEQLPVVSMEGGVSVRVVAGALRGVQPLPPPPHSWAADPSHDVALWVAEVPKGATAQFPPATFQGSNRAVYVVKGTVLINGEAIREREGAQVHPDMELTIQATTTEGADVLVLQGQPINEPVAQHGPFVMNSRDEIAQAFADFRRTGFGGWPWPSPDHAHERNVPRHANRSGQVEYPTSSRKN